MKLYKLQYVVYWVRDDNGIEHPDAVALTEEDAIKHCNGEDADIIRLDGRYAVCPDCGCGFMPQPYQSKCAWCYVKEKGRKCRKCRDKFFPKEKHHMYCDDCQHLMEIQKDVS